MVPEVARKGLGEPVPWGLSAQAGTTVPVALGSPKPARMGERGGSEKFFTLNPLYT
jgi:hypothetical protein